MKTKTLFWSALGLLAANVGSLRAVDITDEIRILNNAQIGSPESPGNISIYGRNTTDPILNVRNPATSSTLFRLESNGKLGIGNNHPQADNTSILNVRGPFAVWVDTDQAYVNSRASVHLSRFPENYLALTVPHRNTAGLAIRNEESQQDENVRNKLIMAVENGALEFKTDVTYNGDWNLSGFVRMKIDSDGRILAGEGLTASPGVASTSQVVVGKFNDTRQNDPDGMDHTKGVFVVGAGSNTNSRQNAIRVTTDGTVLVKTSGDISPGEFTNGPKP